MTILHELHKRRPDIIKKKEVYIDGGVTRGTDVLKALCLGARGVGLGRAFLYANGVWGEAGARRVVQSKFCFVILDPYLALSFLLFLKVMREEIETGMRLLGVTSIDQLNPSLVRYVDELPSAKL